MAWVRPQNTAACRNWKASRPRKGEPSVQVGAGGLKLLRSEPEGRRRRKAFVQLANQQFLQNLLELVQGSVPVQCCGKDSLALLFPLAPFFDKRDERLPLRQVELGLGSLARLVGFKGRFRVVFKDENIGCAARFSLTRRRSPIRTLPRNTIDPDRDARA